MEGNVIDLTVFSNNRHQEAVDKCYSWFEIDRNKKYDITLEFEEDYKLYKGDHWNLLDSLGSSLRTATQQKAHPNTVENVAFALVDGLVSEFSEDVDIIDYPVEEGDDQSAAIMTDLKKYIFFKNRMARERAKWLRYFFLYGTGIWSSCWDPSWRGGRGPNKWEGEIRVEALHPKSVFPDARCWEDIEEGRRVHKAFYRTQEYIKEKFGVEVIADIVNSNMYIGEDYDSGDMAELGEEQSLLVETWYKGKPLILGKNEKDLGTGLHVIWWAGESPVYLAHDNYVYFEPDEDTKFPLNFKKRYPRENSVWGYGEMQFLKSPQIVMNKTSELILEGHMHSSLGQTLYAEHALTEKQKKFIETFGTMPGVWIPAKDPMAVNRIFGKGVPESLIHETTRLQRVMESLVGRFDVSQGRTPGSVTAFRALDLLAARAQVRLRSAEKAIIDGYEELGNYTNILITSCYTDKRAYRILGEQRRDDDYGNRMTVKYGQFDPKSIRKVYFYGPPSVVMNYEEFSPELANAMGFEEGVHFEVYCPQYDSICKVSSTMPTDRMFYLEVAKELLAGQLIDPEIFWYVVSRGKFPPYEELSRKEKEKRQAQEEMMRQQQQAQLEEQQKAKQAESEALDNETMSIQMENLFSNSPEIAKKFLKLTPSQQRVVLAEAKRVGLGSTAPQ